MNIEYENPPGQLGSNVVKIVKLAFVRYFALLPKVPRPRSFRRQATDMVLALFVLLARYGSIFGVLWAGFAVDTRGVLLRAAVGVIGSFWMRRSLGLRGGNLTHGFFVRMWERGVGDRPKLLESLIEKLRGDKLTPRRCRLVTSAYDEAKRALQSGPSGQERRNIREELNRKVLAVLYGQTVGSSTRVDGCLQRKHALEDPRNCSNDGGNKQAYIRRLLLTIQDLHHCAAFYRETVSVRDQDHGTTVWQGDVEVFDLVAHAKAERCYGWSMGEPPEFFTILHLPPVDSAQSAVEIMSADRTGSSAPMGMDDRLAPLTLDPITEQRR